MLFRVGRFGDKVGDFGGFEAVGDVGSTVHALGFEGAFLFREVEEVDVFEGNVIQIEVAAEFELDFDEFGKVAA